MREFPALGQGAVIGLVEAFELSDDGLSIHACRSRQANLWRPWTILGAGHDDPPKIQGNFDFHAAAGATE